MTACPKPVDWRNSLRGLPIAALTEQGITRISKGKDREAQSAIERLRPSRPEQMERAMSEWIKTAKVGDKVEEWREAPGSAGLYLVSDLGRVKSVRSDKVLKGSPVPNGYLTVAFHIEGGQFTKSIHRLVCEAFHQNPDGKPAVNHIDGDKKNNSAENLEWVTYRENTLNGVGRGTIVGFPPTVSNETRSGIIRRWATSNIGKQKIASEFGVSKKFVQKLLRGEFPATITKALKPATEDA